MKLILAFGRNIEFAFENHAISIFLFGNSKVKEAILNITFFNGFEFSEVRKFFPFALVDFEFEVLQGSGTRVECGNIGDEILKVLVF